MEPDRHPEDAAELDMRFHNFLLRHKGTKRKCVLRDVPAGIQTGSAFCGSLQIMITGRLRLIEHLLNFELAQACWYLPLDGVALPKTKYRSTNGRQHRNLSFGKIRLCRKHQRVSITFAAH